MATCVGEPSTNQTVSMFVQGKQYSQFASSPGSFQMYFHSKGWQLIKSDLPPSLFL